MFARAPRLGRVKTRLEPALSRERILALHCKLVQHAVAQAYACPISRTELWVESEPQSDFFQQLVGAYPELSVCLQRGNDLGDRMKHALCTAHHRATQVLIIGSDCPAIDVRYLSMAFEQLESGYDVTIGPAQDGGYVLIGSRHARLPVFSGIDWGTDRVLQQTLNALTTARLSYSLLPELQDIDRPEDLAEARRFELLRDA